MGEEARVGRKRGKKSPLHVEIDSELSVWLDKHAGEKGRPVSHLVERILLHEMRRVERHKETIAAGGKR
jgi:hypothetical protein